MNRRTRRVIASAGAAAALAGAGGAFAAVHGTGTTPPDPKAVLNDVATRLGVGEAALEKALKDSAAARVDAAVAAGTLTTDQAAKIKAQIEAGTPRIGGFGLRGGFGVRHGGQSLSAAATYLGMTTADLATELRSGKTLAAVANEKGKDVAGLEDAIVADSKTRFDAAVAAGRLTAAHEQQLLADLKSRVDALVNGTLPSPRAGFRLGRGAGIAPGGFRGHGFFGGNA